MIKTFSFLLRKLFDCVKVKKQCVDVINERGVENISYEQLVNEVSPKARQAVPDTVKVELLQQLRTFLQQNSGIPDL